MGNQPVTDVVAVHREARKPILMALFAVVLSCLVQDPAIEDWAAEFVARAILGPDGG
jgi:hypothetical protein